MIKLQPTPDHLGGPCRSHGRLFCLDQQHQVACRPLKRSSYLAGFHPLVSSSSRHSQLGLSPPPSPLASRSTWRACSLSLVLSSRCRLVWLHQRDWIWEPFLLPPLLSPSLPSPEQVSRPSPFPSALCQQASPLQRYLQVQLILLPPPPPWVCSLEPEPALDAPLVALGLCPWRLSIHLYPDLCHHTDHRHDPRSGHHRDLGLHNDLHHDHSHHVHVEPRNWRSLCLLHLGLFHHHDPGHRSLGP